MNKDKLSKPHDCPKKPHGWGYIKVDVMMTSIANKHSISTNWYKPSELTYL